MPLTKSCARQFEENTSATRNVTDGTGRFREKAIIIHNIHKA